MRLGVSFHVHWYRTLILEYPAALGLTGRMVRKYQCRCRAVKVVVR